MFIILVIFGFLKKFNSYLLMLSTRKCLLTVQYHSYWPNSIITLVLEKYLVSLIQFAPCNYHRIGPIQLSHMEKQSNYWSTIFIFLNKRPSVVLGMCITLYIIQQLLHCGRSYVKYLC